MEILKIKTERRLLGSFGEAEAVKFLKKSGYRILKKNFVANDHEVDIICEDRENLVFVEVKTRTIGRENPNEPRPASAVTKEKQRSIISAARCYIAFNPPKKHVRLDIIEVYVNDDGKKLTVAEIKHLKGAFDASSAKRGYRR